jgi:3-oxoacyl-[acyl-carrier-protein] synthase II
MSTNGRRRVVITGLGAVSPLGNTAEDSWRNLLAGESGAAEITAFDHSHEGYNVHFAGSIARRRAAWTASRR